MIQCNFRTRSEIHPNKKTIQFLRERMGESFEHHITAGRCGQSSRRVIWQRDQVKLKNTGYIYKMTARNVRE